jgi:UDP-3-O-[3-hydroxymyristoyl] glucosamine N-acyltransferase
LEKSTKSWTLKELADILDGTLEGPEDYEVSVPASIEGGGPASVAFAGNAEYFGKAVVSNVGVVIVTRDAPSAAKPLIRVENPKVAFGAFLALCQNSMALARGIHSSAVISPSAVVDPTASVGPYAVIESGAKIGARARIFPFAFIGSDCEVGSDATIYPHAVLYSHVSVGNHSIVHSHAVIGSDGFGFTWNGKQHVKIPHLGKTEIGSEVEIGAGTTVDRAMLGVTRIGDGSKIDNQVQIGHNTTIGDHAIVASQTGIGGSCEIGDRCTFAGQVGLGDHVKIGNDITMTARAAVVRDLVAPGAYRGAPAIPYLDELRQEASLRRLPQLIKRVKELEIRLEKLNEANEA